MPAVVSKRVAPASVDVNYAQEPFGQVGVRRFVKPALIATITVVALVSVAFWYRSFHLRDSISVAPIDGARWSISSIFGRLVITRIGATPNEVHGPLRWDYGTGYVPPFVHDGWQPSLAKSIGIEWEHAPLNSMIPPTGRDFWLRIQWRTIALLLSIVPIVHIISERLRRRRARLEVDPT